jgi:hypothetical protein
MARIKQWSVRLTEPVTAVQSYQGHTSLVKKLDGVKDDMRVE